LRLAEYPTEDRYRLPPTDRGSRLLTAVRTSYHAFCVKHLFIRILFYWVYNLYAIICAYIQTYNIEKI
jgi:hypothetical protein